MAALSVDIPRTEGARERGEFLDRRSHYSLDGRLWLYGQDVGVIRNEVFTDANGACYFGLPGCRGVTSSSSGHLHHLVPLGRGGDWSKANLAWTCAPCHLSHHPQVRLKWLQ